jgi:hypothetical protein
VGTRCCTRRRSKATWRSSRANVHARTTVRGRVGRWGLNLREVGLTRVRSCAAVTQWMSAVGRGLDELGSCAYIASSPGAFGVRWG